MLTPTLLSEVPQDMKNVSVKDSSRINGEPFELILLDRKRCRYRRTDRENPSANPIYLWTAICCSRSKIIQAIQTI